MFAAINMKFYGKANLHLHLTLRDTLNQSETRPAAYFVFPHIFSIAVIYTVIMGLQPEILIKENIHTYKENGMDRKLYILPLFYHYRRCAIVT